MGRRRELSVPLKSPDIVLNGPDIKVDDEFYVPTMKEMAAENAIYLVCRLTGREKATGSLNDLAKGLFGADLEIFVVRDGQGVVKYLKPLTASSNRPAQIYFENFDENSAVYRNLRGELEKIAGITTKAEIEKILDAQQAKRNSA